MDVLRLWPAGVSSQQHKADSCFPESSLIAGAGASGTNMSVAVKKRRFSAKDESVRCAGRSCRLVPHLLLWLSLVGYAALGGRLFQVIEGPEAYGIGNDSTVNMDYREFVGQIVSIVQNLTDKGIANESIVEVVEKKMLTEFNSIWFQTPERWTFFGAMFFCCTVFTTVGYGEIYPVTLTGKVVCVLYAMVGIPLMLLVILDVGDFLAMLMTKVYVRIYTSCKNIRARTWSPWKERKKAEDRSHRTLEDGTFVFSQPLDIRQVLQTQGDLRHKSVQLENNKEIFEKILARENLLRKGPLLRALSCPELDQLPKATKVYTLWDFTGLGDGMEMLDVPVSLILFIVIAYIFFGGFILPFWETDFKGFDPYYFCFITLTTIGFGDIVPSHPKFFMLVSLFNIVGMAIMTMAFKLCQTRLVLVYRQCIKFISRFIGETFRIEPKY